MAGGQAVGQGGPGRLFLSASYVVLLAGGVMLGLFETLLLPYSVSSAYSAPAATSDNGAAAHVLAAGSSGSLGTLLSVGLIIAILANPALSMAGIWMAGTRLAAATPLIGWLAVVLPFGSVTTDGNNVLPGNLRSAAFLLLGILAFTAVAVLARPTRGVAASNGPSPPAAGGPRPRVRPVTSASSRSVTSRPVKPAKKSGRGRTAPKGGRRR